MIRLSNQVHEPTVQLSNEDLDKVSGGTDNRVYSNMTNNKASMGERTFAANDAAIRG
jgi:hypothetical protein